MDTKERMQKRQQRINIFARIDELLTQTCEECRRTMRSDKASRYRCSCPASVELRKVGQKLGGVEKEHARYFTEKDDRILIEHYRELTGIEIAEMLNRSKDSIYSRIKSLKRKGII